MKISFCIQELRITQDEAMEVIDNGKDFYLKPSMQGNNRLMFVGFTMAGTLCEVGVEFVSETEWQVFHAMPATKTYRTLFSDERKITKRQ